MTNMTKLLLKRCYLDANILAGFTIETSPFHQSAVNLIISLISNESIIVVSSLGLDEFLQAMRKDFIIRKFKPDLQIIKKAFTNILKIANLELVNPSIVKNEHRKVINFMEKYNLRPRDAYHLFIMKSNKIKYFATFDNDFQRVFEAKVLKKFE